MTIPFPSVAREVPDFAMRAQEHLTTPGTFGFESSLGTISGWVDQTRGLEDPSDIAMAYYDLLAGSTHGLASPWWLTRDYIDFVEAAALTLPEIHEDYIDIQPPSPSGSIWLARPFDFVATDGTAQSIDAISWANWKVNSAEDNRTWDALWVVGWVSPVNPGDGVLNRCP